MGDLRHELAEAIYNTDKALAGPSFDDARTQNYGHATGLFNGQADSALRKADAIMPIVDRIANQQADVRVILGGTDVSLPDAIARLRGLADRYVKEGIGYVSDIYLVPADLLEAGRWSEARAAATWLFEPQDNMHVIRGEVLA